MSELDEILASQSALASAGAGQFTVDPRRQRELLAKLGLQNTSQGFLKLCQGIYRCGVDSVHFSSEKNSVRMVAKHKLPLPTIPWEPSHPLGLALLSLSQEYRVDWASHHQGKLYSGYVSPESFQVKPPQPGEAGSITTIEIRRPSAKWWHRDWTAGVRLSLRHRLGWARGEFYWNGGRFPVPNPLPLRAQATIFADKSLPGDLFPSNYGQQRRFRLEGKVFEQAGEALVELTSPAHAILGATRNSWSETFFVLDGVLLEGERNLLDRPGVVAVVSADGLTPALSGLELVHDAAFRQRLQGLRPEVAWLDAINQRS